MTDAAVSTPANHHPGHPGQATHSPGVGRDFRRVLLAEGVSVFGAMLSRLALPWFAALVLGSSAQQMGWLHVADLAAAALGALLLGALVDRSSKRRVMVAADLARALLLAGMALAAAAGRLNFVGLLIGAAAAGLLNLAFELARSAWMAQRLADDELPARNASLSMVASLAEALAFALGGWLFQWLGPVVSLAVDAASYLASALCLRGVQDGPLEGSAITGSTFAGATSAGATSAGSTRAGSTSGAAPAGAAPTAQGDERPDIQQPPASVNAELRRWWHECADGLQVIRTQPALRTLAALEVLLGLGSALSATSYMIFVSREIGFSTGPLGLVFAAGGLGAVLGALCAARLSERLGPGRAMLVGLVALTLGWACVPLVVAPSATGLALLLVQQVVGDAGGTVQQVHDRTLRQTLVPLAQLARADAGLRLLGQLAALAGAIGGGWLADVAGTRVALWLATGLVAAASVWVALALDNFAPRKPVDAG